jgi:hypothetical protein
MMTSMDLPPDRSYTRLTIGLARKCIFLRKEAARFISLKLDSQFEVLASGLLDMVADRVRSAGIPFGVGGLARVHDHTLPVPPHLVYPQYPRLGATSALVSRSFLGPSARSELTAQIATARQTLTQWAEATPADRTQARDDLRKHLRRLKEIPAH